MRPYSMTDLFLFVNLGGVDFAFGFTFRRVEQNGSLLVGAQNLAIIFRFLLGREQFDNLFASLDMDGPFAIFALCDVIDFSWFLCHGKFLR